MWYTLQVLKIDGRDTHPHIFNRLPFYGPLFTYVDSHFQVQKVLLYFFYQWHYVLPNGFSASTDMMIRFFSFSLLM